MTSTLQTLLRKLDSHAIEATQIIPWGAPVLSFGDISQSTVATLGLNPSNREFVNTSGDELDGSSRRFPTLGSLGLSSWSEADNDHMELMLSSFRDYFDRNPYDAWFKRLDFIISGVNASFYDSSTPACHLDLIPYATACKWTELSRQERLNLLNISEDSFVDLLIDSPVRTLILNGQSVVDQFEKIFNTTLNKTHMPAWTLPRQSCSGVPGFAYSSTISTLSGKNLRRSILVLGYNHNIQSSFGVTKAVMTSIRDWITSSTKTQKS